MRHLLSKRTETLIKDYARLIDQLEQTHKEIVDSLEADTFGRLSLCSSSIKEMTPLHFWSFNNADKKTALQLADDGKITMCVDLDGKATIAHFNVYGAHCIAIIDKEDSNDHM